MDKIKIGISVGDINGIGLEVILKTLAQKKILEYCIPVIYGSTKVVSYHKNIAEVDLHYQSLRSAHHLAESKVNVVNCWNESVNITVGKATDVGGQFALRSLEAATKDLKNGLIHGLVTAPISKEAMKMANFPFPGHTEYLTKELGSQESLMFMLSDRIKVGLVTNHDPLKNVVEKVNKNLILKKLSIMEESLKVDFGIERPIIAVLGLNPHAGDNGVIGEEEEQLIRPAVVEAKKKGTMVMGPFPADSFFGSGHYAKFDGILAMYHDQGLIAFKTLAFGDGVNYTAGLSGIRTSPDHGTAFDIAGKNTADPASFRKAMYYAIDIARNRKAHREMHKNKLQPSDSVIVEDKEENIE